MKAYELTDEHRAKLKPWVDKWIANAMSTRRMTEDDRRRVVSAVHALYRAADLDPPKIVIWVSSPMTGAVAACLATGAIWLMKQDKGRGVSLAEVGTIVSYLAATDAAARDAVEAATDAATHAATYAATYAATHAATYAATYAAFEAVEAATYAATYAATDAAVEAATDAAARDAAERVAVEDATYAAVEAATDAATHAAVEAATYAAVEAATDAATHAATYGATYAAFEAATDAVEAATYAATYAATGAATDAATHAATGAATHAATGAATHAAVEAATDAAARDASDAAKFLLKCCTRWTRFHDGGSHWSGYTAFLSFFRHVAKLEIDWSIWQPYEILAELSASRFMHRDFVIISERPTQILVDNEGRPHCDNGPSHTWEDGNEIYYWHGVIVPRDWIVGPGPSITDALSEPNAERRRAAMDILGWDRVLNEIGAQVIDENPNPQIGTLLRADLPGAPGAQFLRVRCGTGRTFSLPVPETMTSALEANAETYGVDISDILKLEART